ncbi:NAD(P)/FAD-dependent oxidoreductase [Roseomonas sp. M0104]|uniref:NAD(P)/FAD-dependent oxidoreductase n=1 Tax=Teichococcus coralli TaxID=2545983 RepID=A0A845BGG5_9PROT|nr:NAD(P)/FAD-dependent oxidoreductase [Pseudoroseomonas coralli]MXP65134.1 NAD(P)/FAD-dependent oxidoreductase [Pseudoroseomonas coralli]
MAQSDPLDLIVLGSGVAGSSVATRCASAGWRVALAEAREFGGTCALRGCEPKKVFWTLAEAVDRARRLAPKGVAGGEAVRLDWGAAQRFKHSFTDPVPEHSEASLRDAGVEVLHGEARFVAPDAVEAAGRRLAFRHTVIATGAHPAKLPIEGAELLATSDEFLALERLPQRMVMVGGGYISFECAHLAARGGAEVTLLHANDEPLAHFDQDLVRRLVAHTRALGVTVKLGCKVSAIRRQGDGTLQVECENGERVTAEMAVHGLGRRPALESLDLEAGEVAVEKGRLRLDRHLRSASNPRVFAAGDAAQQGPALTPVAGHDAGVVARNLLEGCRSEPDYSVVPSVVFTIPPMAMVGMTEAQAREQRRDFELKQGDMASFQSVRRTGEDTAAYKLLLEPDSGHVLGAHLLAPEAPEVMNLFAFAMRFGVPAAELRAMMTAYPSFGSNLSAMLG